MINVLEYLNLSCNRNPNKIAVIEEDKKITYQELNNCSKIVGSFLASNNIFNEPVVIYMDKGIDALISFFGVVYSSCYYTLINPEFPYQRVNQIIGVLSPKYVITDDKYIENAKEYFKDSKIFNINDLKKEKINEEMLNLAKTYHNDINPLYINFTSGSTGVPKGVVIGHKSVIDFIDNFTKLFNFNEDDIIANQAPFDFDVSVKDIYSAIKVGATLVIVPKAYFSSPAKLLDYLCLNNVTTLTWAVSALCLITTFHGLDYKVPDKVNKILFSGEVMPVKHLNIWRDHLPNTMFVNLYGPTEITCNCTYYIIDNKKEYDKIPIGKAFPNEKVFLLDKDNKLVTKKNEVGEVCVAGTCLALGYFNNKEQTDKHFVQNPLEKNYNEMIYKTGDLAFYNDDNDLVFNGRVDFQIKYQGHRIELEEIEKSIMDFDEVERACCIFEEEKSKLYAFYVGSIDKKDLHLKLKEKLPVFMIPSKLIQIDEFPINKNGKIDRKVLLLMKDDKHD